MCVFLGYSFMCLFFLTSAESCTFKYVLAYKNASLTSDFIFCTVSVQLLTFIREGHMCNFVMNGVSKNDGAYQECRQILSSVAMRRLLNISWLLVHPFCRSAAPNAFVVERAPYEILTICCSFGR